MIILHTNFTTKVGAGTKAPEDIYNILKSNFGSKTYEIRMKVTDNKILNNIRKIPFCIKKIYKLVAIKNDEWVVLQSNYFDYPFIFPRLMRKILMKKKSIYYIHDINGLRYNDKEKLKQEISLIDSNNYIIVHNNTMKKYLVDQGINNKKIFVLECFDYLCDEITKKNNHVFDKNNVQICYAGNLSKDKAEFLYEVNNKNYELNLFGKGIQKDINDKIKYKGIYEANKVRDYLFDDLGLIWDGHIDDSYSYDNFKNYTKYNNPHKLSCYLASDLPVIVWSKSAIAEFVKENNIGYIIDKLQDIDQLKFDDYGEKKKNAMLIGEKIRNGYYTLNVLNKILDKKGR